uniref:ditrans,polycis-polyprenyl diphosphate synthase [(2E,6E)-farnesyldiphosphate specific] n=1 Tax=Oryza punctata TaxID=4537 RepID=A0A0E0KA23_ORYPU
MVYSGLPDLDGRPIVFQAFSPQIVSELGKLTSLHHRPQQPPPPPPPPLPAPDAALTGSPAEARQRRGLRAAFVANEIPLFMNQSPPHVWMLMSRPSVIIKLILGLLWFIVHLAISLFSLWFDLIYSIECYLISFGLIPKYRKFQRDRLKHLAVVVDSREAKNVTKIHQLLCWLSNIGVKYVCLYDIDGVVKKTFAPTMNGSRDENSGKHLDVGANMKALTCCHKEMTIEYISGSDGKDGIAKAASLLCSTCVNSNRNTCGNDEIVFTEADMSGALKAIGCGGPEPDLLLVYGPARCHLGFPAWRLRYTEIMHMGPLNSMKYGAIVKAFYKFSKKYQNFDT